MNPQDFIITRLEELRRMQGMSKYRLAQLTGISQTALSKILSGQCMPTVMTLDKLCKAFQISMAQFFADNEYIGGLTENQREILSVWNSMNDEEKRICLNFIRSIKEK